MVREGDTPAAAKFSWNVTFPPFPPLTLLGALMSMLLPPLLPFTAGTVGFFIANAFFFGLAGFFIISWRKRKWEETVFAFNLAKALCEENEKESCTAADDGDSEARDVSKKDKTPFVFTFEDYPVYLVEGTFFTLLIDLLFTAGMLWKLYYVGLRRAAVDTWMDIYEEEEMLRRSFPSNTIFFTSPHHSDTTSSQAEFDESSFTMEDQDAEKNSPTAPFIALEQCIFAAHFGFLMKDAFFCTRDMWEPMMPIHHLGGCILLLVGYFSVDLPGVRLLALSASVLELGSASCCAWLLWRLKVYYMIAMNLSNAVYLICLGAIYWYEDSLPWWFHFAVAGGVMLVIGRTAYMIQGIHTHFCEVGKGTKMQ